MGSNDTKKQKYVITKANISCHMESINTGILVSVGKKTYTIDLEMMVMGDIGSGTQHGAIPDMNTLNSGNYVCVLPYHEYEELLKAKEAPKNLVEEKFDTYDHLKGEKIYEF